MTDSGWRQVVTISAPRFIASTLGGAIGYLCQLCLFLATLPLHSSLLRGFFWITSPVFTASGFWAGAAAFNRLRHLPPLRLRRLFLYPLVGCYVGAAVVFPFGPMLIVFGMCLLGSLAMLLFEIAELRNRPAGTKTQTVKA